MKKWLIGGSVAGILLVALSLVGLATGVFAQVSVAFSDPAVTTDEVKATVLQAYPGTNIVEVELEREHGTLVYEVGLDNGLEVMVDANTGILLGPEQEDADEPGDVQEERENDDTDEPGGVDDAEDEGESDDANELDESDEVAPANTGITADDARAIAEEAYPDATVLAVEFDREGGIDLFEAELDDGADVIIDANTGEILWTETRDAD